MAGANVGVNVSSEANRTWLVYLATIGAIMAALKLRETWNDYQHTMTVEEARVENARRDASGNNEPRIDIELLDRRRPVRKANCCVCMGIDCGLFWKATGILLLGLIAKKIFFWSFIGSPTGLEDMPAFSTSLVCREAPFKFSATFNIPVHASSASHSFETIGEAIGTLLIAQGAPDATDVKYEVTIRTEDQALLKMVDIREPEPATKESVAGQFQISTPRAIKSCLRYDIKMYVPQTLKNLRIATYTKTHLKFDPDANVELDNLSVNLKRKDPQNMVLPTDGIRGKKTTLEIGHGWMVGDVAVVEEMQITTRASGVTNLHIIPSEPRDMDSPEPAILRTNTGAGRTDIFYSSSKVFKRPISSRHSAGKSDMYLHYKKAEFGGKVSMAAPGFTTYNLQSFTTTTRKSRDEKQDWTHWAGNKQGDDRVIVKSDGWVGLYF